MRDRAQTFLTPLTQCCPCEPPSSLLTTSVLQVYLGMVLHDNKKYRDALDMLELASKSEPRNPQVRTDAGYVFPKGPPFPPPAAKRFGMCRTSHPS